ncbi:MAG: acyltransferase family protein, partial [Planctomycetota bacterium]
MDLEVRALEVRANEEADDARMFFVRGLGATAVVALHAAVAYLVHPFPGLEWPTQDTANTAIDLFAWWIELWVMPLFLVVSGCMARISLRRRGMPEWFFRRMRRLGGPLLLSLIVLLPLDAYVWMFGWYLEGLVTLDEIRRV